MFDFLGLRKSVASIAGKIAEQRADLEQLKRKREEVAAAAPAREDVIRIIGDRIDSAGDEYPKRLQTALQGVLYGGKIQNVSGWQLGFLLPQSNVGLSPSSLMGELAFIFGAELKEAIARAVARMDWPECAISLAAREKELARLDAEIGELEKQISDLASEAAKAGVQIG